MAKRIAALVCSLSIVNGSVCWAQVRDGAEPNGPVASVADKHDGPLRRATVTWARSATTKARWSVARQPDDRSSRPWIERHPVITGALIGFGIGVGLTYAAGDDDRDEFLTPISAGSAALVWGGVTAGLGALAGWGIGRASREAKGRSWPVSSDRE